jgi:uncharacterized membrane protein YcaP (DUF421 family)
MDPAQIDVLDWRRMFLGDLPLTFLVEVAFRTAVMYLYALLIVRLIGKRGIAQLSPFDYVIIVALGSAVGDPMFYAQVPLIHGMLALTVVVVLERGLAFLTLRNVPLEQFVEGTPRRLVLNGRLDLEGLNRETISQEELFARLRESGVEHLGQVKRAYIEQSGKTSIFRYDERDVEPGLPLIPPWDLEKPPTVESGTSVSAGGSYACTYCGEVIDLQPGEAPVACPVCQETEWTLALAHPVEQQGADE